MEYILPGLLLLVLGIVLLLNLLTLPANWIMVGIVFLWKFTVPNPGAMDVVYLVSIVALAVVGELIEFVAQAWGSKRYGSTNSGLFGGLLGAIVGAIACAPFFFGLGALFGAFGGAWGGCYLVERLRGRTAAEAWEAAKGAMLGRFLGIVIKCGIGGLMLVLTFHAVWPGSTPLPEAAVL